MIVDFIMGIGNAPMIEGAKKFGYTYVDTAGTTYVDSHPDAAGHVFIANKIIEALPSAEVYGKYADVFTGHKYYNDIEYCLVNGILTPKSATMFGIDDPINKADMVNALNVIKGSEERSDNTTKVTAITFAAGILTTAASKGFTTFFKGFTAAFKLLSAKQFNIGASITKGEAAHYFNQVFGA